MATSTEYTRGWVSVTTPQGGITNTNQVGATNGDQYGPREADIYWADQVKGGVHMTQFLANERGSNASLTTTGYVAPAAQMTKWRSKVALITTNDKPLISQNLGQNQVFGDFLYGTFGDPLAENGSFQGNSNVNGLPTTNTTGSALTAAQVATYATAQIGWGFTTKAGDTLPASGVVGPWARSETFWDNGNYGSNSIGQVAH